MAFHYHVTPELLQNISYVKKITVWTYDTCPVCDYPMKFRFNKNHPQVENDPGCTCSGETYRPIKYEPSTWEQVAHFINNATEAETIKQISKFWEL